jgi:nucleoside-diphosphate-sugar epimerase
MPARVLVTGASGFIGSHLTRLLVREGCAVYVLLRNTSSTWRIEDILPKVEIIRGDLLELDAVMQQLKKIQPEICIHLAWYAEPGKYWVSEENLRMLSTTLQLASCLAKLGCKKFVGTGTCVEYDTDLGYLSENSSTKPRSLYAAAKLASCNILIELAGGAHLDFAWARLFQPFGPYEDQHRLVPSIICSLLHNRAANLTKGEQIRDFLHVQDVARAIWAITQSKLSGPVNVGSGTPISVRDLAAKIGDILGKQDLLRFGALPMSPTEPKFICANNARLRDNTAWVPLFDLEEGLRHTITWWKRNLLNT